MGTWSLAWRQSGGAGEGGGGGNCGVGGDGGKICGDGGSAIAAATSSPPQVLSLDGAEFIDGAEATRSADGADDGTTPMALSMVRRACNGALWTDVAGGGGTVMVALAARGIEESVCTDIPTKCNSARMNSEGGKVRSPFNFKVRQQLDKGLARASRTSPSQQT